MRFVVCACERRPSRPAHLTGSAGKTSDAGGISYAAGQPRPSKGSLHALLAFEAVTATTFFAPLAFWRRRGREGKAARWRRVRLSALALMMVPLMAMDAAVEAVRGGQTSERGCSKGRRNMTASNLSDRSRMMRATCTIAVVMNVLAGLAWGQVDGGFEDDPAAHWNPLGLVSFPENPASGNHFALLQEGTAGHSRIYHRAGKADATHFQILQRGVGSREEAQKAQEVNSLVLLRLLAAVSCWGHLWIVLQVESEEPYLTGETPVPHLTGETPVPHLTGGTPVPHLPHLPAGRSARDGHVYARRRGPAGCLPRAVLCGDLADRAG